MKEKCTKSENGRKVSISESTPGPCGKKILRTDEGKADLKLRPMVESVNGVLKNRFGLSGTKSWGAGK